MIKITQYIVFIHLLFRVCLIVFPSATHPCILVYKHTLNPPTSKAESSVTFCRWEDRKEVPSRNVHSIPGRFDFQSL